MPIKLFRHDIRTHVQTEYIIKKEKSLSHMRFINVVSIIHLDILIKISIY